MDSQHFIKQPSEVRTIGISFLGILEDGITIDSSDVTAKDFDSGTDATALVVKTPTGTIKDGIVRAVVQGGTVGRRYKITFKTTLSNGDILEDDLVMRVLDL